MNNNKSITKGELERRIRNAIVLVPKTKDTISVFFDDKILRLTVTDDFAVIETGFHRHVFNQLTPNGVSRPYLYTKRFIEIALENDCIVKDANGKATRSYAKLMDKLKEKEDKTEYNLCWFVDLWFNNIFHPLYGIDETESAAFLIYDNYLHNIARNQIILSEKKEDVTNLGFIKQEHELVDGYIDGMKEAVIFHKLTDEERKEQEIKALQEHEQDNLVTEQANGNE